MMKKNFKGGGFGRIEGWVGGFLYKVGVGIQNLLTLCTMRRDLLTFWLMGGTPLPPVLPIRGNPG